MDMLNDDTNIVLIFQQKNIFNVQINLEKSYFYVLYIHSYNVVK